MRRLFRMDAYTYMIAASDICSGMLGPKMRSAALAHGPAKPCTSSLVDSIPRPVMVDD
jgi:hypothetical protein